MYILIAEMLLALGVIIFIFWWTLSARIDHPAESKDAETPEVKSVDSTRNPEVKSKNDSTPPPKP